MVKQITNDTEVPIVAGIVDDDKILVVTAAGLRKILKSSLLLAMGQTTIDDSGFTNLTGETLDEILADIDAAIGTVPGGAADVAVTDAGGYFTGTDAEAVLQELGATVEYVEKPVASGAGGTETINISKAVAFGYVSGDIGTTAEFQAANRDGSLVHGITFAYSDGGAGVQGAVARLEATSQANHVFGHAYAAYGGEAVIGESTQGNGSHIGGAARASGADSVARFQTLASGAIAHGYAYGGSGFAATIGVESINGKGAFAMGSAVGFAQNTAIAASGPGSMAFGNAEEATIQTGANADGAMAFGYAKDGNDIEATGKGALAFGSAVAGDISASAANAVQFGPGANAVADSLSVGGGMRFRGVAVDAPANLRNGDMWLTTTGDVMVRTGGASKSLSGLA